MNLLRFLVSTFMVLRLLTNSTIFKNCRVCLFMLNENFYKIFSIGLSNCRSECGFGGERRRKLSGHNDQAFCPRNVLSAVVSQALSKLSYFACTLGTFMVLIFVYTNAYGAPRSYNLTNKVQDISTKDAAERWQEFASAKQTPNYFFDFDLIHYPRKSQEVKYEGSMLGKDFGFEYRTRLILKKGTDKVEFLLIVDKNGKCSAWKFENGKSVQIADKDINKAIDKDLIYTPFDIMMPYKYWPAQYLAPGRIGQAVYYFLLKSPKNSEYKDLKIALSRDFNHPVLTQSLDKDGNALRSFTLGSVKKIGDFWIMKSAEIRDEISRDKDKFSIQAANLSENLDAKLFKIENLGNKIEFKPLLESLN